MNCYPPPPCISVLPHPAMFVPVKDVDYTPVEKMDAIALYVSRRVGIHPKQLFLKTRKRHIVLPRQIVFYLCCRWNVCSLNQMAAHFGGVDHTTVIHSRDTIKDQMKIGEQLKWVGLLEAKGFSSIITV